MPRVITFFLIFNMLILCSAFAQQRRAALSGELSAQDTRGLRVVQVTTRRGKRVDLYKGSYALLIGVSDYTAGWPDLESIPGELDRLEAALRRKGFSVTRVRNPNARQLRRAFDDFIDAHGFDPENRLLFFYSGHGYTRTTGGRRKGYLVPTDAPNPNRDLKNFNRRALTMTYVLAMARRIEAKHALFLFDSCFSGTIFRARALPVPRYITNKTAKPVRQFITAGSAGEEVPAKSVFLPSFIRAIEGEGDTNRDGYVTGSELGAFLNQRVLSYDTGQTPQYGKIRDPDLDEGDFVFLTPMDERVPPDKPLEKKPDPVAKPEPKPEPEPVAKSEPVVKLEPVAKSEKPGKKGPSTGLLIAGGAALILSLQQYMTSLDDNETAEATADSDPDTSRQFEEYRDTAALVALLSAVVGTGLLVWAFQDGGDGDKSASAKGWGVAPVAVARNGRVIPGLSVRYGW
ncbi:MAG: caspase family protein [SAR324 cluster bacterium]|nr:caspase family protein [SAR324 cluster bacterium]